MIDVILIINAGSSSLKCSIFRRHHSLNANTQPVTTSLGLSAESTDGRLPEHLPLKLLYSAEIGSSNDSPCITLFDSSHQPILIKSYTAEGVEGGLHTLFQCLDAQEQLKVIAVGHRVVHGGQYFFQPTLIDDEVIKKIASLIPLAPYHQPQDITAIHTASSHYPGIPQFACFDTSFHHTQAKMATLFAIPRAFSDAGIKRYGFHGLSYEYIASIITQKIGEIGNQKVIVAHLGNGASICAMYQRKSVATSMGLTALDGLMMGSRCGKIDPGVILHLVNEHKLSIERVKTLLYRESGLLGVSGISSDMRELESNPAPHALEAIDLYCYLAAKELTALCTDLGGADVIIFTAGIGEKSALVRKKICAYLQWLGVVIDERANYQHETIISQPKSTILVGIIPTNENDMIAQHCIKLMNELN